MLPPTSRLGLRRPEDSDKFDTLFCTAYSQDVQKIDESVQLKLPEAADNIPVYNDDGYLIDSEIAAINVQDAVTKRHYQNTDQYLDYGGSNQVSAAQAKESYSKRHDQNKDQYLDYGGSNQVSASDAKDAVSKKHTQGTDQYLDYGGSNQVSAAQAKSAYTNIDKHQYLDYGGSNQVSASDAKDAVSKKHTQGTDQYLDHGGSNQVSAAQAKSAYTNIDKHQYLDYGGSNQMSAAQLKKFYKHELNFNLSGGGVVIATGLHGGIQVPFACTIKKVRLLSVDATSGSITVDVWKGTYSSPPTSGGSIGSWSISSGTKSETTGLSISLSSEDILYFNVSSVTSLKLVLMVLEVEV